MRAAVFSVVDSLFSHIHRSRKRILQSHVIFTALADGSFKYPTPSALCWDNPDLETNLHFIGGPAYLSPIFASNVLSVLLQIFSSQACPQSLILQILETLNIVADRLPLDPLQNGR